MQPSQYLIMAREIKQTDSGIFSYLDVCENLYINKLPANGKFDLAIICGPGWEPGKYHVHLAMKIENEQPQKIGYIDVNILDKYSIYTAKLKNLGITIKNELPFYFMAYKHPGEFIENDDTVNMITGELIIERPYKITITDKQLI